MTRANVPQPHEQPQIEQLLVKLAKLKPISANTVPIVQGMPAIRAGFSVALPRVFLYAALAEDKRQRRSRARAA